MDIEFWHEIRERELFEQLYKIIQGSSRNCDKIGAAGSFCEIVIPLHVLSLHLPLAGESTDQRRASGQ